MDERTKREDGPLPYSILLVDGDCALCHGMTRFAARRDRAVRLRIAALQSDIGRKLLADAGLPAAHRSSMVLMEQQGRAYVKSSAALHVLRRLDGWWPLLYAGIVIPRPIRDFAYDLIARSRYRLFGKSDLCMLPSAAGPDRFIQDDEQVGSVRNANETDYARRGPLRRQRD